MEPMLSSWTWPDTLIEIGIIVATMVVAWQLAVVSSRRVVRAALSKREQNRSLPGLSGTRTRRLLGLDHNPTHHEAESNYRKPQPF